MITLEQLIDKVLELRKYQSDLYCEFRRDNGTKTLSGQIANDSLTEIGCKALYSKMEFVDMVLRADYLIGLDALVFAVSVQKMMFQTLHIPEYKLLIDRFSEMTAQDVRDAMDRNGWTEY